MQPIGRNYPSKSIRTGASKKRKEIFSFFYFLFMIRNLCFKKQLTRFNTMVILSKNDNENQYNELILKMPNHFEENKKRRPGRWKRN